MCNKFLLILASFLLLSGCITTYSKLIKSDIRSYVYDYRLKITDKHRVTALKTTRSNNKNDTKEVGLTLKYDDVDNIKNTLFIPAADIDAFRDLLKKKASVPEGVIDTPTTMHSHAYKKVTMITDLINNKRVISINSLSGNFVFHEADTKEILRLLDDIQKENM